MDSWKTQIPVYVKTALFFIATFGVFYVLYIGQEIIIPLVFAALFAVLLNPIVVFLIRKKVPRIVAISLAILAAVLLIFALITFICMQLGTLSDRFPELQTKFNDLIKETTKWIAQVFDIKLSKVRQWVAKSQAETLNNSTAIIGVTLSTVSGLLSLIILIPIYVFMMLYYEPLFIEFIKRAFAKERHAAVNEIIVESKAAMQHYLGGLLIEAIIVAIMNSVGLLIIGIEYAVLWGIIGALLNIIPYIGGVIAVALPIIMALITEDSFSAVWLILILYSVVQFIDNNIIVPKVVASRVQINALVSVIAVLLGGALWGVPGMFLSIPLIAVVKIICDRVEALKPFGYLLGDAMPGFGNRITFPKRFRRFKRSA